MNEIMYPQRYEQAVKARIESRTVAKRRRLWLEEAPAREELIKSIEELVAKGDGFANRMMSAYLEWGSLTEKQETAILNHLATRDEALMQSKIVRDDSEWVGVLGDKVAFTGTVEFVTGYESRFGYVTVTSIRDDEGNLIVHKGRGVELEKGDLVAIEGRIKSHDTYRGIKQTRITHPKVLGRFKPEQEAVA